jgi:DNA recombination protein RmuC
LRWFGCWGVFGWVLLGCFWAGDGVVGLGTLFWFWFLKSILFCMEILLVVAIVLILVVGVLVVLFRPRQGSGADLQNGLTKLTADLARIEANLKDDFKANREESFAQAKENRAEQSKNFLDFKADHVEAMNAITDKNEKALGLLTKTMDERLAALIDKVEHNHKSNREEQANTQKIFAESVTAQVDKLTVEVQAKLQAIAETNAQKLEGLTLALETKLNALADKTEYNHKTNREEQATGLKTFSEAQVLQLKELTISIQSQLNSLTEQAKKDSDAMREALAGRMQEFQTTLKENIDAMHERQKERFSQMDVRQGELITSTNEKLEKMRETVDEKLQKTLNDRLGQSFETVSKQLLAVENGLGEMKTLAQDVGGLKRVLSNVKMRGGFGEVQLSLLLEQILAPEQYESNVTVKPNSAERVEFAVKLPGKDDDGKPVYLAIDAKFPREDYEQLQEAYDAADPVKIEAAQKRLESAIRKMAKDIHDKYIAPPHTTDFAIMFLPFEGIYAEVVRKAALLEDLQRHYKVIVTGPTTLAAILNSLQMGFKTLSIQRHGSEVWKILGAVKTEFGKFGGMLDKVKKNLHRASNDLDLVVGARTRAIERELRSVEALPEVESGGVLALSEVEEFGVEE